MILLDTNILIEILKNNHKTIQKVKSIDETLAISSISVIELYYGARNKSELREIEKFTTLFHIIQIDEAISSRSIKLVKEYAKSHNLDIPDSLIASTAIVHNCRLFTYNLKDFRYIKQIELI